MGNKQAQQTHVVQVGLKVGQIETEFSQAAPFKKYVIRGIAVKVAIASWFENFPKSLPMWGLMLQVLSCIFVNTASVARISKSRPFGTQLISALLNTGALKA